MTAFDGLTFKQGLTKVGYPDDQAEALSALIRDQVVGNGATNADLLAAEQRLNDKIERVEERLKAEIKLLDQSMTIKLTGATIVVVGAVAALQRLLGA